jgi:hypothetical protein
MKAKILIVKCANMTLKKIKIMHSSQIPLLVLNEVN